MPLDLSYNTASVPPTVPDTPRRLPHRRRSGDSAGHWMKIAFALVGLATTLGGGYWSGLQAIGDRERSLLERIVRLETSRENEYKAIMARLDELQAAQIRSDQAARADLNGIRDEIIRIIRNQR